MKYHLFAPTLQHQRHLVLRNKLINSVINEPDDVKVLKIWNDLLLLCDNNKDKLFKEYGNLEPRIFQAFLKRQKKK